MSELRPPAAAGPAAPPGYRARLFEGYHATHAAHIDEPEPVKRRWFRDHVRRNYLSRLPPPDGRPRVLELGCARGFLLAALDEAGYGALTGVDLSAPDLERAAEVAPRAVLQHVDALEFMTLHPAGFDVIIAKAVLEHVSKPDVLAFLDTVRTALAPGGRVIIEVPNMDWLFAQHERYMDFTHEVGFTRESLAQVLRASFGNASVAAAEEPMLAPGRPNLQRRLLRPVVRRVLSRIFRILGEGAADTLWHARSIVGVAEKRAP